MIDPVDSEIEFGAIIEEYFTYIEQQENPDRESFFRRYPKFRTRLEGFFSDLDLFDEKLAEDRAQAADIGLGRALAEEPPPSTSPRRGDDSLPKVPGFRIIKPLGRGSQGRVFKAEQLGARRFVALKIIREGALAYDSERIRFDSEIALASKLQHPNIVSVYGCGTEAGADYFFMEYIDGVPLDEHALQMRADTQAAVRALLPIVEAVSYAHQRGVIHRDLKPGNVLVDKDGVPHILDFGLAKSVDEANAPVRSAVTCVGDFAGTWLYASPEQTLRDSRLVDVRSDVYSLGVILYEFLVGKLPYPVEDTTTSAEIAKHITGTPPVRPNLLRPGFDVDLETILLRTLAKEPERRYQSAHELASELKRFLAGEAIEARRDSAAYVLRKALQKYRWLVRGTAVGVTVLIGFSVVISILYSRVVSANATTRAKMEVVRDSQRYLVSKLRNLQSAENLFEAVRDRHPASASELGLNRTTSSTLTSRFEALFQSYPVSGLSLTEIDFSQPPPNVSAWLQEHHEELLAVAHSLESQKIEVHAAETSKPGLLFDEDRDYLDFFYSAGEALGAAIFNAFSTQRDAEAVLFLNGARLVANDLSDSMFVDDKNKATSFRSMTYNLVLNILEASIGRGQSTILYADWLLVDPPLPPLGPAFVAERTKWVQFCEEATYGDPKTGLAVIDENLLREIYGPYFPPCNGTDGAACGPTPSSTLLSMIDLQFGEIETWDHLTPRQLLDRRAALRQQIRSEPSWSRFQAILPDRVPVFLVRFRDAAVRDAARLAGELCRFREIQGRWPANLSDLPLEAHGLNVLDRVSELPFVYSANSEETVLLAPASEIALPDEKTGVQGAGTPERVYLRVSTPTR